MITLTASADYGLAGQYIARITGRDSKFTFRREFIGRKGGKRGERTEADVDEAGLYEICDVGKRGKDSSFVLVVEVAPDDLTRFECPKEGAMSVAKALDAGRPFGEIVRGWDADEEAEGVRNALEKHRKALGNSLSTAQEQAPYELTEVLDGLPVGTYPRLQVEEARKATIARLEAELTALHAAGKPSRKGYEILTAKQAEQMASAATVEQALSQCQTILAALSPKDQKKVLAALKANLATVVETATK